MRIGIIGGSGLYEMEGLGITEEILLRTPYGAPSAPYALGSLEGREVVFLPRHGARHQIPPHSINYRANIWGLRELGVERIISISAVGGINRAVEPGSLVLLDQIIDMTFGARASTFYNAEGVIHVDFTEPYCPEMRAVAREAASSLGTNVRERGTYVCVNGPRLETAAEIAFFAQIGGDVVGMTAMPEASLSREVALCMVGIVVVTNPAAGVAKGKLTTVEVIEAMKRSMAQMRPLVRRMIIDLPTVRRCPCKDALSDAGV